MRKVIITTSLVFSALIILDSLNLGHALMMFLVAGQIPGTKFALDATTMLWLSMGALGFIVGRLSSSAVIALEARSAKLARRTI